MSLFCVHFQKVIKSGAPLNEFQFPKRVKKNAFKLIKTLAYEFEVVVRGDDLIDFKTAIDYPEVKNVISENVPEGKCFKIPMTADIWFNHQSLLRNYHKKSDLVFVVSNGDEYEYINVNKAVLFIYMNEEPQQLDINWSNRSNTTVSLLGEMTSETLRNLITLISEGTVENIQKSIDLERALHFFGISFLKVKELPQTMQNSNNLKANKELLKEASRNKRKSKIEGIITMYIFYWACLEHNSTLTLSANVNAPK